MPRRRAIPPQGSANEEELEDGEFIIVANEEEMEDIRTSQESKVVPPPEPEVADTEAPHVSGDDPDSGAPGGDKRNLSLEALFQAAHSELENISKEKIPEKTPQGVKKQILKRVSTEEEQARLEEEQAKVHQVVAYLEVPDADNTGKYILHNTDRGDTSVILQDTDPGDTSVIREMVRIDGPQGQTLMTVPPGCSVVHSGETIYEIQSESISTPCTPATSPKPLIIKPEEDHADIATTLKPGLMKPGLIQGGKGVQNSTGLDMKGITTVIGVGGRKRKHPQKPGKHICPYCQRGCAKPSVLQKHIRAHTGERPYPCNTCGFAFKTKSNLYKHCKSRWHLLKVGLSQPQHGSSEERPDMESDGNESDEDADGDEDDEDGTEIHQSQTRIVLDMPKTQTPINIETISALKENTETEPKAKKRKKLSRDQSAEDEVETAVKNVKLQSGGMMIDRQASIEPDNIQLEMSVDEVRPDHQSTANVITRSPKLIDVPRIVFADDNLPHQTIGPLQDLPGQIFHQSTNTGGYPVLLTSLSPNVSMLTSSPATMQVSMSTMNMPIKVTPSVVQSASSRKHLEKAFSTNDLPLGVEHQSRVNISRSVSLHVAGRETKPFSPEKLMERISNLISTNQAIVSTPMAMPPRKRILRQQSSTNTGQPQSQASVPVMFAGQSVYLNRSASLSDKLASLQSASLSMDSSHPAISRSLSVQPSTSLTPIQPQPTEPLFIMKQSNFAVDSAAAKPVMQLPQALLAPTPGANAPKEIKIQFKMPGAQTPVKIRPQLSRSDSHGPHLEVPQMVQLQETISDASESRKTDTLVQKNPSQLAAILQGYTPPILAPQPLQPKVDVLQPEPTYVCGGCWQSFTDIENLKFHQQVSCVAVATKVKLPPETPPTQTIIVEQAPKAPSPPPKQPVKRSPEEGKHRPPKLTLQPSTELIMEPNLGPITMVTPPTPTPPTPSESRKRGVLQRQKNVVLEMVDPRVPPKRGRPKGARSVDTSYFGGTGNLMPEGGAKRPLLLRSQSTIEPSASTEEIPGELRCETPEALWKLKLKGRLLMKRSMSVERMLSQEKEQEEKAEKQNKALLSPISAGNQIPLLRSKSYDETVTPSSKPIRDGDIRERILSKLSKSCHNLTRSISIDMESEAEGSLTVTDEPMETQISDDPIIISPTSETKEGSEKLFPTVDDDLTSCIQVNHAEDFMPQNLPTFAPHFNRQKLGTVPEVKVPVTLCIPVNIAHRVPGLLQEAKLTNPEDGSMKDSLTSEVVSADKDEVQDKVDDDDDHTLKIDTPGEEIAPNHKGKYEKPVTMETADGGTTGSGISEPSQIQNEPTPPKKRNICTLHTIQMAGLSKQVRNKIQATLLLLSHSYPSMKTVDMCTFCCIHKTQPMYVELGDQRKISMYSNWRAAPYNPNPQGLASKQLLDLYQTQRYDCEPRFLVADSSKASCGVTQSSYWSVREKEIASGEGEMADDIKKARENIKVEQLIELMEACQHDPVPVEIEPTRKIIIETLPQSPIDTIIEPTTKDKLKEVLNSDKSKKTKIFEGGYKSTEEYIYVRGRGRGKYICGKCGIRCKKPSMLKKHIRTHTDVRPYHCRYCNFSFKTKGNLTKHMKSKTHHKLCMDMGIVPVPTSVDDDCLRGETSDEPESGVIYADIEGPTIGHIEEVGGGDHQFSDCDDDEDDDDDEEDDEEDDEGAEEHNQSEQQKSSDEVQLVEVEVITNPIKDTTTLTEAVSDVVTVTQDMTDAEITVVDSEENEEEGCPASSLDKEIAAASLLDLSQVTKSGHKQKDGTSSEPYDAAEDTKTAEVSKSLSSDTVTARDITVLSTFNYIRSNNTYAQKIAMLQVANQRPPSGFAPPFTIGSSDLLVVPIQSQQKQTEKDKKESSDFGPIVGQFIRPDVQVSLKSELCNTSLSQTDKLRQMITLAKIPWGKSQSTDTKVKFVEDEGHAPREIMPIPIKISDEAEERDEDGHYVCQICKKTFEKKHQFILHKNIHTLEGAYRCEDCSMSFQTRLLLDKHETSEQHLQKVSVAQQQGDFASDDPRPHKCDECNIAFRIQGHLARHLRSKMHISKLEALGKVPVGTYDQVEYESFTLTTGSVTNSLSMAIPSGSMPVDRTPVPAAHTVQPRNSSPSPKIRIIKRSADSSKSMTSKRQKFEKSDSISREDDLVQSSTTSELLLSLPAVHGSKFQYQQAEYEKVDVASNDRVTVEMKAEPIELGEIEPKVGQKRDRDETEMDLDTERANTIGPHKCGICGKTFCEISYLKRHLVSHAELRPYVCEYCDAGFTTAQSLKFHLRTHTQDRPYLCGHCGTTFSRAESLHDHMQRDHLTIQDDTDDEVTAPTSIATALPTVRFHPKSPGDLEKQQQTAESSSISTAAVNQAKGQYHMNIPNQTLVSGKQTKSGFQAVTSHGQSATVPLRVQKSPSPNPVVMAMAGVGSSGCAIQQSSMVTTDGNHLQLGSIHSADENEVIELDMNNYELQECIERGPDGTERTIYMLVVPEGKLPMIGQNQIDPVPEGHALSSGNLVSIDGGHVQTFVGDYVEGYEPGSSVKEEPNSSTDHQKIIIETNTAMQSHSQSNDKVQHENQLKIKTENVDESKNWRVIHMTDGSMSLSPIFDEDNLEGQSREMEAKPS